MNNLITGLVIFFITIGLSDEKIIHKHVMSASEESESIDITSPEEELVEKYHVLRRSDGRKSWKVCFKKAAKACVKSCKKAFKAACKKRRCTSRAKKILRRECKNNCRSEFGVQKFKENVSE